MPPGVVQVGKYHNRKRHNFMPLVIRHGYRILLLAVISNYYSIEFACQGFPFSFCLYLVQILRYFTILIDSV